MSRSRIIILNLEELRPNGMPATCFERMSMASLASDVNKNHHEFAVQAVKQHS